MTGENEKGDYNPGHSQINFVVPQRSIVSQTHSPIAAKDVTPGILHTLFDKFSQQSEPGKTYKLCVDGKKINSSLIGKHGDIDLWGHESSPTIAERRGLLNVDVETIENCSKYLQNKQQYITSFEALSGLEKENIATSLKTIITLITKRLQTLRENVLLKEANKDKLMNSITGDWRKSRLVFVISGLITHLYDMKACIRNLLRDVDDLCMAIAHLNDCKVWIDGTFPLKNCRYHITISSVDDLNRDDGDTFRYIEQRSPAWNLVRKGAKITGSTMFNGLALGTLKSQLEHYDSVVFGKDKPEPGSSVKERMQYGVDNEKHALATFAGKFLPIFHSDLRYFEEGCYSIRTSNNVEIVISPDGSCRRSVTEQATFGVECKCPFPGKTYATTVHYAIPKYYVPQVLSEMRCLETNHLYFVSYSKESTSILKASFDQELWTQLEQEASMIYHDNSSRPTRKSPTSKIIQEQIAHYVKSNVELIAEMRSIKGEYSMASSGYENGSCTSDFCSIESLIELLSSIRNDVQRGYDLTRAKASELLAFMISDLDREYSFEQLHSVPIAYGLKGYSLPTSALREMIDTVLGEGVKRGLYTPVCSFDGQWSRIAVRDRHNRPLTVLQLQKDVFRECRKLSKPEIIRLMSSRNMIKSSEIKTQEDFSRLIGCSNQDKPNKSITLWSKSEEKAFLVSSRTEELLKEKYSCTVTNVDRDEALDTQESVSEIMTLLPVSVVSQMDDELVNTVQSIEQRTLPASTNSHTSDLDDLHELFTEENEPETSNTDRPEEKDTPAHTVEQSRLLNDNDITLMLYELQRDKEANKQSKWMISVTDFKSKMENACEINKNFLAYELQLCLKPTMGKLKSSGFKVKKSDTKHSHVNLFSQILGDKSELPSRSSKKIHKVQSLRSWCKNSLQKIPKEKLNIVLAENLFPQKLEQWYKSCPYGKTIEIEGTSSVNRKQWYSYPEMNESLGFYVFMILDAYHQLCGLRRLLCASGIPEAGISNKPIHKVAEESEFNGCGLNVALVKDLIDKQSVAYAVQTFSGKVESALSAIGAHTEAKFCALVRHWYEAEDDPGIPAITRCEYRLQLRDWLLDNVNFGEFPPYGSSVKGIPMILYEGLLTGIERRIQLFPLVKSGMYNVRCVGSLDVENFFGGFQDYDPWGTGVLRPDSIPTAISVAAELQEARLDPNR